MIASLNHPNICHLYDVGPDYLVMELVDGVTLAEQIDRRPISLGGGRKPVAPAPPPFAETHGHMSPDWRWLAYEYDESGANEIPVRRFSPDELGGTGRKSNRADAIPRPPPFDTPPLPRLH